MTGVFRMAIRLRNGEQSRMTLPIFPSQSNVQARSRARLAKLAGLTLLLGSLGYVAYDAFLGTNLHAVVRDRVYRSAQLDGPGLAKVAREYGIRTIINLRGRDEASRWYMDESRSTHDLGIALEDIALSSGRMPPVDEVRRILEILDHSEPPILIHCRRGADRTGLVSAVARLWLTEDDLPRASRQLGVRYAHLPLGRPLYLDRFLDQYGEWLANAGTRHSRAAFKNWLDHYYGSGALEAKIELEKCPPAISSEEPSALCIRCTNRGSRPWQLRPGANAGIHAQFFVRDETGTTIWTDRAGLFEATVDAGEAIRLTVALPPLHRQGRFSLFVDMVDEQHCSFFQLGSEPLLVDLNVY